MDTNRWWAGAWIAALAIATLAFAPRARADAITDWNAKACEILVDGKLAPAPGNRALAITQTAVYEATNAITRRYPASALHLQARRSASIEAAVAAANRASLTQLVPTQQAAIDAAYRAALAGIAEGPAKTEGIALGEKAAAAILAARAEDGAAAVESYRPETTPGRYVATSVPAFAQWPQRKPWLLASPSQFRPGPPPALGSELWARDYNEIKAVGRKDSASRSPEQTEIARFWENTSPAIYHGLVRSLALQPGRDPTRNARLFAAVAQAADDSLIAVFDAKYHYAFWRPVTAIRNGDRDGNEATERDPSWLPFIDTPMHPEYPCAHCIVSGTVGTVLRADIGAGPMPVLRTTSATANGAARSWTSLDEFMQEVANARIYDGVHYRNSTEVGTAMGIRIGELAARRFALGRDR
jgi:hypothetical protein